MSLLANLATDESIATESDSVGGGNGFIGSEIGE